MDGESIQGAGPSTTEICWTSAKVIRVRRSSKKGNAPDPNHLPNYSNAIAMVTSLAKETPCIALS
jgi:hypothetical protein